MRTSTTMALPLNYLMVSLNCLLRQKRYAGSFVHCDHLFLNAQYQGNVEYKLKLINPSEERFAKLVTQLKWRLLEGGGQAYYELGVADSGQLVGLSRLHLEQSLQTLEEMAGEIGASVIVVKEIQVPSRLLDVSSDGGNKGPDGAKRMPKLRVGSHSDTTNTCDSESGTPSTDWDESDLYPAGGDDPDMGDELVTGRNTLKVPIPTPSKSKIVRAISFDTLTVPRRIHARSHPDRPTPQDSPAIRAFEGDLGDDELDSSDMLVFPGPFDLSISSVYKPRQTRKRKVSGTAGARTNAGSAMKTQEGTVPTADRSTLKQQKFQKKRRKGKHDANISDANLKSLGDGGESASRDPGLTTHNLSAPELTLDTPSQSSPMENLSSLTPNLQALCVSICMQDRADISHIDSRDSVSPATAVTAEASDSERRVMVEVLIVRKMSVEEAFLDFGGFSLS